MNRKADITRKTNETDIALSLDLEGQGKTVIKTGIPFFNHMLEQFGRHSFCDLSVKAAGDLEVDFHHTVEDVGIALGEAVAKALGDKKGIFRYGSFSVPMDDALVEVCLDLSNRPVLVYNGGVLEEKKAGGFPSELVKEFFQAVANSGGITLHINIHRGNNAHHIIEAMFKAFAKAFSQAAAINSRVADQVLSTKGRLS